MVPTLNHPKRGISSQYQPSNFKIFLFFTLLASGFCCYYCKLSNNEPQHNVPWVCVEVLGSRLSSITLLLLWRTRRSSASSTFRLILLLCDATAWRGWGFTLSWCAELMEMLIEASAHQREFPPTFFFFFFFTSILFSTMMADFLFSTLWSCKKKFWISGRFMINRTKQEQGRLTVQEPSSSCEQSQTNETLLRSKKTFVHKIYVDWVCTPAFCWQASKQCLSWFSPSFRWLRLPWCQALVDEMLDSETHTSVFGQVPAARRAGVSKLWPAGQMWPTIQF